MGLPPKKKCMQNPKSDLRIAALFCVQTWLILIRHVQPGFSVQPAPCGFNSMCLCAGQADSKSVSSVQCDRASLYKMPAFPHERITHLEVTNNNLLLLESDALAALPLQLLKLSGNSIRRIDQKAFRSITHEVTNYNVFLLKYERFPLMLVRCDCLLDLPDANLRVD
ncbi:uncharacterized protein LOC113385143 [Ctenocephalides felis]|uniref:uncharacterized protein LOC113385143 n=1 Tax=Ctenocephalides felis TaxID=7515 RepID=UPI000E6E57A7|nr:uncharacterized protein LOC113385143 [Ctenocephalides felis]